MTDARYHLLRYPDGSTAVTASYVAEGDPLFEGPYDACIAEQASRCTLLDGLWYCRSVLPLVQRRSPKSGSHGSRGQSRAKAKALAESFIGKRVLPYFPDEMTLTADTFHAVTGFWLPLCSPLFHLRIDGVEGSRPFYATPDLRPAFVTEEDLERCDACPDLTPPNRNGEWVRPLDAGGNDLSTDEWYSVAYISKIVHPHRQTVQAHVTLSGAHGGLYPALGYFGPDGEPAFERWFERYPLCHD